MALSSVAQFKIWSAVVIWILGLVGGLLPLFVQDVSPRLRSVLNMFAGGIFFAGAVLHLLPDAVDNVALEHLGDASAASSLWAYFFFAIGFFMILFAEVFALQVQRYMQKTQLSTTTMGGGATTTTTPRQSSINQNAPLLHHAGLPVDEESLKNTNHHTYNHPEGPRMQVDCAPVTHAHVEGLLQEEDSDYHLLDDSTTGIANLHNLPPIVSMIVFVALSFHSVMEGVAVGSNPDSAWDIFFAIVAHKAFAAFALGLELVSHSVPTKRLIWSMLLFSLMSPFGIALGWWIITLAAQASDDDDTTADGNVASGICTALSAGTFLYVAVMEIIPQEFQNPQDQGFKCLALFIGFASFGTLAIWV